jgi:hypothetical protein
MHCLMAFVGRRGCEKGHWLKHITNFAKVVSKKVLWSDLQVASPLEEVEDFANYRFY